MGHLSVENPIMRMGDGSLPRNQYHVRTHTLHACLDPTHVTTPITPPPHTPYTCPILANLIFLGNHSRSHSHSHTSSDIQLRHVQPPSTPISPHLRRPPTHGPSSSPPKSNPLPRVSISTSAELKDAVVVSSKGAGGHAGEC